MTATGQAIEVEGTTFNGPKVSAKTVYVPSSYIRAVTNFNVYSQLAAIKKTTY